MRFRINADCEGLNLRPFVSKLQVPIPARCAIYGLELAFDDVPGVSPWQFNDGNQNGLLEDRWPFSALHMDLGIRCVRHRFPLAIM